MDITLDDVLTVLDEHYNNIKALDALNQELFQLQMADKEAILDWGVCPIKAPSSPCCFISRPLPSRPHGQNQNVTAFTVGYPNVLKPWWPTLRQAYKKSLIPITCRLKGKQRRKTPWSYPKAHEAKQPIMPPNQGWLVSSPCRSPRRPSQQLTHPPCTLCTWNRRDAKKDEEVESEEPGSINRGHREIHGVPCKGHERHPDGGEAVVIIVAVWSASSATAP